MLSQPNDAELDNVIRQMVTDISEPCGSGGGDDLGVIEVSEAIEKHNFRSFALSDSSTMMAVDGGSSTLLDAGSFTVAALRVGSALYRNRAYIHGEQPEIHLLHISALELGSAYSIFFGKTVGGEPPDAPRGLEEAIGRIRTLMEWKHLENMLALDIEPGTVLAFDGALWAGIKGMGAMVERIVRAAREKGVILCGISKKSMLTHLSKPLIPVVQMAGEAAKPGAMWHYPVDVSGYGDKAYGEVHVAKLHPQSRYVFRVDLSLPDGIEPAHAFGKLAYHANDPTYTGYPYPLARVHNDVAMSRPEAEGLRNMLRGRAIRAGMDPAEWEMTFQNFHDVLDMNR